MAPVVVAIEVPVRHAGRAQGAVEACRELLDAGEQGAAADRLRHGLDQAGRGIGLHQLDQVHQGRAAHHAVGVEHDEIAIAGTPVATELGDVAGLAALVVGAHAVEQAAGGAELGAKARPHHLLGLHHVALAAVAQDEQIELGEAAGVGERAVHGRQPRRDPDRVLVIDRHDQRGARRAGAVAGRPQPIARRAAGLADQMQHEADQGGRERIADPAERQGEQGQDADLRDRQPVRAHRVGQELGRGGGRHQHEGEQCYPPQRPGIDTGHEVVLSILIGTVISGRTWLSHAACASRASTTTRPASATDQDFEGLLRHGARRRHGCQRWRGRAHRRDERFRQSLVDQDQVGPAGRPATCQERRAPDRQCRLAAQFLSAEHGRQPGLERLLGVQRCACAGIVLRLSAPTGAGARQQPLDQHLAALLRPDAEAGQKRAQGNFRLRRFLLFRHRLWTIVRLFADRTTRSTVVQPRGHMPRSPRQQHSPQPFRSAIAAASQPRLVLEPDRCASLMPVAAGPSISPRFHSVNSARALSFPKNPHHRRRTRRSSEVIHRTATAMR